MVVPSAGTAENLSVGVDLEFAATIEEWEEVEPQQTWSTANWLL
jgi:hypothetical protein